MSDRDLDLSLPKTSEPASAAFARAGIRSLNDLTQWTERDLLAVHGVGPKAIRILREHLAANSLAFRTDDRARKG